MTTAETLPNPEEVDELKPGTQLLHGQYKIREYLNAGGFGITYLAGDSLDRTVVIKECFPGAFCRRSELLVHARSRAFQGELRTIVQLFLQEARSLARLQHPNIVGVHQVFEGNNTAYMALDFVEGSDLFELIERRDPRLKPATIRAILEKLLDAIGAVHSAGLLHRDISPDNIIVTETMEPVLIDFGAAREQATRKTRALSALRIVKDGYSPQEFYVAGSEQGPASDLYSLAATFYHLITGHVPPNSQLRVAAHVDGQPDPYVPLAKQTDQYDTAFCEALDRAIGILPRSRFQSAHEWLDCLKGKRSTSVAVAPKSRPIKSAATFSPAATAAKTDAPQKSKMVKLLAGAATALVLAGGGMVLTSPGQGNGGADAVAGATSRTSPPAAETTKAEAAEAFNSALAKMSDEPAASAALAATPDAAPRAATPAPAVQTREELPGVGVLTVSWTVDLPFTTTAPDGLVISSTRDGAAAGLVPGMKITEVEGQPVASLSEAVAKMQSAKSTISGEIVTVTLTLKDEATGKVVNEKVAMPVIRQAAFPNGLSFRSHFANGAWVTEVAEVPADQGSDLRSGDVVVATMPTREPITDIDQLRDLLVREALAGKTSISIVVRRDGLIWVGEMAVGATAG
ncbi:protein kinase domain-containing protein [Tabrizicola sp.]|uniref:protein kinase domain-containing protein n=1 Tax=Tabrizicola sp. TaxID=2005166 RepID=UPI003F3CC5E6